MYSALLEMRGKKKKEMRGDRGKVIDMVSPTMAPVMDDIHIKDLLLGDVA